MLGFIIFIILVMLLLPVLFWVQDRPQGNADSAQIRDISAGVSNNIAPAGTGFLLITANNPADIISAEVRGVVGEAWDIDTYIESFAGEGMVAASLRDNIPILAADTESGHLAGFGCPFNAWFDFTNNNALGDTIDDVVITYRSRSTLTLTWE